MCKHLIISFFFLCISPSLFGQKNTVLYFEGLGAGVAYSINIDTRFTPNSKFGYRLGGSLFKLDKDWVSTVPVQINYILGRKHGIEIGAGGVLLYEWDDKDKAVRAVGTLAYRYQGNRGFNFRLSANTYFADIDDLGYFYPGFSFGWRLVE